MKKRGYCYCSFYANRRRIGGAYVPECSTGEERQAIAKKGGIMNHNGVKFEFRKLNSHLINVKRLKGGGVYLKNLKPIV